MNPEMGKRIQNTEKQIEEYFERSKATMLQKNRDRGDCWRNSGLLGQFIEIHSMYFRLRRLIWDMGRPKKPSSFDRDFVNKTHQQANDMLHWEEQVRNALEDLRNFTMLAEMCLEEDNWKGDIYTDEKLTK